jgi:hypothetical protein
MVNDQSWESYLSLLTHPGLTFASSSDLHGHQPFLPGQTLEAS